MERLCSHIMDGLYPTGTSGDVHQIISGSTATVVIRDRVFNNFVNFEGNCAGIFHYLFLYPMVSSVQCEDRLYYTCGT